MSWRQGDKKTWQPRGVPGPGSHEGYQDLAATRGTRTWQPRGLPLHFLTWMEHDKKCRPGSHEGCHYISSHGWSMIRNVVVPLDTWPKVLLAVTNGGPLRLSGQVERWYDQPIPALCGWKGLRCHSCLAYILTFLLEILTQTGFAAVDVLWKKYIFAVYIGMKRSDAN